MGKFTGHCALWHTLKLKRYQVLFFLAKRGTGHLTQLDVENAQKYRLKTRVRQTRQKLQTLNQNNGEYERLQCAAM